MIDLAAVLPAVVAAVEREGARLLEEFHRPEGARGRGGKAPIDTEMEERLREALQAIVPCTFGGEETGTTPGTLEGWAWLVDPQDGTSEFISGKRGSAIAVALLRGPDAVLGVVHSPNAPDRGHDTIAWAEGLPHVLRNGAPVRDKLADKRLEPGALCFATASTASRPQAFSRAFAPARYIAMPSIAYRLARVAAGDGVATLSIHPVNEYDIAAGLALVRAAGGVVLDAQGSEIVLTGSADSRVTGCYAGAPHAARHLQGIDWKAVEREPKQPLRLALSFPRPFFPERLSRAVGCLAGQVIGDARGAQGLHTLEGQPTDHSELALVLARKLVALKGYEKEAVLDAYRAWLVSRPVDVGMENEKGLIGRPDPASLSSGALIRVAPLGIWAAGDPARAARLAREDAALTHPHPDCLDASAALAAAIATGVAGGDAAAMARAAAEQCAGAACRAVEQGMAGETPGALDGSALAALRNAFFHLARSDYEQAVAQTVAAGGDASGNAAVAGALVGALRGREALPARALLQVMACRPIPEAGALRPRPMDSWPDDLLDLAEALLLNSGSGT